MRKKAAVAGRLPVKRGFDESEAAVYLSLSPSFFRKLVEDKRMPRPRLADGLRIWDVEELDLAFKPFPREGGEAEVDIRGIGNRLRHEYDKIDRYEIWRTVKGDLTPLPACERAIQQVHRGLERTPAKARKKRLRNSQHDIYGVRRRRTTQHAKNEVLTLAGRASFAAMLQRKGVRNGTASAL